MSRAPLVPILSCGAVLLAAIVAFEAWDGTGDADANVLPHAASRPARDPAASPALGSVATEALVPQILARPLFAPDRRPEQAHPAPQVEEVRGPLPRLAGIVTIFDTKLAIFAGPQGGKPVVAGEGAEIDGHKIQSIGPEEIVLVGPGGQERLRPLPDPTLQHLSRPISTPATRAGAHKP